MMAPYTAEVRPDTGLYNAKLGMWLFLAADTMFFGALFSSYAFLRTAAYSWPNGSEILPVAHALFTATALVVAAVAIARFWSDLNRETGTPNRWAWVAVLAGAFGLSFLLLGQRVETGEGMTAATNTFYACWYLLSGIQIVHVAVALGATLYLILPGSEMRAHNAARYRNRVECLGLFWQFLALAWLATFACFYVA